MTIEEKVQYYVENFGFEICAALGILCSIMYFIYGKSRNDRFIISWLKGIAPAMRSNFAHLGFDTKESSLKLHQASYTEYEFYAIKPKWRY